MLTPEEKRSASAYATRVGSLTAYYTLHDSVWQSFGFKKTPRRGKIFNFFIGKEQLNNELVFQREIFVLFLAYGLRYLTTIDSKTLYNKIFYKIMDNCLERLGFADAFGFNNATEMLEFFYEGFNEYYFISEKEISDKFIERIYRFEISEDARWMVGIIKLHLFGGIADAFKKDIGKDYLKLLDDIEYFNLQ